jgi:hypothetical protein
MRKHAVIIATLVEMKVINETNKKPASGAG